MTPDNKRHFDIPVALRWIDRAVRSFRKAAMFELADEGHRSLFEQLIACLISIRTFDETTVPCAQRLFALGRTPREVARLSAARIDAAIRPSTFHETKARQIRAIAGKAVDEWNGRLPCDVAVLTSFAGVGPKCANLALGIACGESRISVDVHVHRVTNRWGVVRAPTPEKTMSQLETVVPRRRWIDVNRLLVPFGKHICTGSRPRCSTCPVRDMCRQVGVTSSR